jgi:hypothetical protein
MATGISILRLSSCSKTQINTPNTFVAFANVCKWLTHNQGSKKDLDTLTEISLTIIASIYSFRNVNKGCRIRGGS